MILFKNGVYKNSEVKTDASNEEKETSVQMKIRLHYISTKLSTPKEISGNSFVFVFAVKFCLF